jgi:hypothetical protein
MNFWKRFCLDEVAHIDLRGRASTPLVVTIRYAWFVELPTNMTGE